MNRELSMEFVRVTEAAAIACGRSVGRGDKNGADQLAVDAMRKAFDTVNISGTVVIGEGEMDEAPMLYIGEKVGGGGAEVDIAVDPVEGTNLVAKGQPGAIAVIAIAPKGCLLTCIWIRSLSVLELKAASILMRRSVKTWNVWLKP